MYHSATHIASNLKDTPPNILILGRKGLRKTRNMSDLPDTELGLDDLDDQEEPNAFVDL